MLINSTSDAARGVSVPGTTSGSFAAQQPTGQELDNLSFDDAEPAEPKPIRITRTLEEKLADAEAKVEKLGGRSDAARAASERATPGGLTGYDPGVISGVISGISGAGGAKQTSRRFAAYNREAAAAEDLRRAKADVAGAKYAIAKAKRDAPITYDPAILIPGSYVRSANGWHKVVRVNKTTVSVATGYSWTDKIVLGKIVEVRPDPKARA
jgi:hypothetical protein